MSKSRIVLVGAGIAGVIALSVGSGAVAGSLVTSADIKDGAVHSPDIADNGVRSPDIRDGGVHPVDLASGIKEKLDAKGEPGPQGEKGEKGDPGQPGQDGQDGVGNPEVDGTYHDLIGDDGKIQTFTVECADGKVATGGGFSIDFPQHRDNVTFVGSTPAFFTEIPGDPEGSVVAHGWEVQVINNGPTTSLRTWVACATMANAQ